MHATMSDVEQNIRDLSGRDWLFPGDMDVFNWTLAHPEHCLLPEEAQKRWWDNLDADYRRRLEDLGYVKYLWPRFHDE
jgi:hypothetical protein